MTLCRWLAGGILVSIPSGHRFSIQRRPLEVVQCLLRLGDQLAQIDDVLRMFGIFDGRFQLVFASCQDCVFKIYKTKISNIVNDIKKSDLFSLIQNFF